MQDYESLIRNIERISRKIRRKSAIKFRLCEFCFLNREYLTYIGGFVNLES